MAYNFHTRANLVRRDFRLLEAAGAVPLSGLPMRSEQHQLAIQLRLANHRTGSTTLEIRQDGII